MWFTLFWLLGAEACLKLMLSANRFDTPILLSQLPEREASTKMNSSTGRAVYSSRDRGNTIYLYHDVFSDGSGRWLLGSRLGSDAGILAFTDSWAVAPHLIGEASNTSLNWHLFNGEGWALDPSFQLICADHFDDNVYFETSEEDVSLSGFYMLRQFDYPSPVYTQIKTLPEDDQMYLFKFGGRWQIGSQVGVNSCLAFAEQDVASPVDISLHRWNFLRTTSFWKSDEGVVVSRKVFDEDSNNRLAGNVYEALRFQNSRGHSANLSNQFRSQLSGTNTNTAELQSSQSTEPNSSSSPIAYRPGVIILGMHRSGTSIIAGLVSKMGLNVGGPLIHPAGDNEKGYFERVDVVLQNYALMAKQNIYYSQNTYKYDALLGTKHVLNDKWSDFQEGVAALAYLNSPDNYPWVMKDPRLCITIRSWLPLLNFVPAIVFAYRHPLDVALSMNKREFEMFPMSKGLRLWYVHNRRAVEQSQDLCRVVVSHHKVMAAPGKEFDRIHRELVACGVPVPHRLSDHHFSEFIDERMLHYKNGDKESCELLSSQTRPPENIWRRASEDDLKLYREAVRVFCALEDRSAFAAGFSWDQSIIDN